MYTMRTREHTDNTVTTTWRSNTVEWEVGRNSTAPLHRHSDSTVQYNTTACGDAKTARNSPTLATPQHLATAIEKHPREECVLPPINIDISIHINCTAIECTKPLSYSHCIISLVESVSMLHDIHQCVYPIQDRVLHTALQCIGAIRLAD